MSNLRECGVFFEIEMVANPDNQWVWAISPRPAFGLLVSLSGVSERPQDLKLPLL